MAEFAVDSSALVAIFKNEPERDRFEAAIAGSAWVIGWPTILEVRIWLIRNRPIIASQMLDVMVSDERAQILPFDGSLESLATSAFVEFGKGRHPAKLNYGDCMAYAVAKHHGLPLLFKGGDFTLTDIEAHQASTA